MLGQKYHLKNHPDEKYTDSLSCIIKYNVETRYYNTYNVIQSGKLPSATDPYILAKDLENQLASDQVTKADSTQKVIFSSCGLVSESISE